jgi:ATP-dependent RNA helicase DHX8/PRP22
MHEPAGDILAFLTGFDECERAVKMCNQKLVELAEERDLAPMIIVALYGSQTAAQQANAFLQTPANHRKVVFATNIAETSLTVDGVGYVIDAGLVKQKQFNPLTGMDSLVVVNISKVQAVQRAGRAGRTREGKCIRLYDQ